MKSGILEPNEQLLRLSLIHNAFDYLSIYNEYKCIRNCSFKELKILIIFLMCFYESYFKWIIENKDGKEAVWADKSKPFNEYDYEIGDFHSIGFKDCVNKMLAKAYISSDEKDIILRLNTIRDRIIHFGFVGEVNIFGSHALLLDKNDLNIQTTIISNLLKKTKCFLSPKATTCYKELIDSYTC